MKNKKGFTLMEILMVISVMFFILGVSIFSFNAIHDKQSLDKQTDFIKVIIAEARQSSLNSKNGQDQKIIFSTTSFKFNDQIFDFENNIELNQYNTGTNTITFYRVTGLPSATGTLEFALKKRGDVFATSSIMINALGIIE